MGIFEFILLIVIISTLGKVLAGRGNRVPPPPSQPSLPPGELDAVRQAMDDLSERLARLEEERDFYVQLLEDPRRKRALGGDADAEDGAADR